MHELKIYILWSIGFIYYLGSVKIIHDQGERGRYLYEKYTNKTYKQEGSRVLKLNFSQNSFN